MITRRSSWELAALRLVAWFALAFSACHNDCSRNGLCNKYSQCECFSGYEGVDCSRQSCPSGPTIGKIPGATDSAHVPSECSGRGDCDYSTGQCTCYPGFTGPNCGQMYCFNNCNGRGECVSLGVAASAYDGYRFNRTTVYTQWDANVFHGCKCDVGWGGADCSERVCDYGVDPRVANSGSYKERVTLVCACAPTCTGKFKLRFMGQPTVPWLTPTSTTNNLAAALTTVAGRFANNGLYSFARVTAYNGSGTGAVCHPNTVTRTIIKFRRSTAEAPLVSFYANLVVGGSMYFETRQKLMCDCTAGACNGTFRLSFDGEMSGRLRTWGNGTDIAHALQQMRTIKSAGAQVDLAATTHGPVCVNKAKTNHTIVLMAPAGNMPKLGLWSSVVHVNAPLQYSTYNTSQVLRLATDDGRDDAVQLCNGIGTCDFRAGVCNCPYGWGPDAELGPCGSIVYNTSTFPGIGRCPGVVAPGDTQGINELTGQRNYHRIYLSMNPVVVKYSIVLGGVKVHNSSKTPTKSVIQYYDWVRGLESNTFSGPEMNASSGTIFLNLTSNVSAGPVFLDQSRQQLFFVDMNPKGMFIGLAPLARKVNATASTPTYKKWLTVTRTIFGFTADARAGRRILYWTCPGQNYVADGKIYWAYMDAYPVVSYTLNAVVGASHIVDPMGIAVHHFKQRLYWVDKNITTLHGSAAATVLRSCNFDGSGYQQVDLYRKVDNHTVSVNVTDLVIDYFHNNTAFFIDQRYPAAIIATNLDAPIPFNGTNAGDRFVDMTAMHVVCDTVTTSFGTPTYLGLDIDITLVLWTDPQQYKVNFARYVPMFLDHFATGTAYNPPEELDIHAVYRTVYTPVGITFDPGLGTPNFPYRDCFGRGRCTGFAGNYVCQCDTGAFGNCQARTCPWAPAWWQEPVVDEIAHDQLVECANMGQCDRISGQCHCRPGFEGSACERMLCQGQLDQFNFCSGRGRCLSLRELGRRHLDQYLSPVPVVYGTLPHDPATWDADMIYGCYADEYGYSMATGSTNVTSYIGETLSNLECPYGYNMRLTDKIYSNHTYANFTVQYDVQQVACSGTSGYFSLSFRGLTTPPIFVNATMASMRQQLRQVSSIGDVVLQMTDTSPGAPICSSTATPNLVNVTFVNELGLLPLLQVSGSSIAGAAAIVYVQRAQRGYGPLQECSGKGYCDRSTGVCNCWSSWGSSDGLGNRGTRGDCGYSLLN